MKTARTAVLTCLCVAPMLCLATDSAEQDAVVARVNGVAVRTNEVDAQLARIMPRAVFHQGVEGERMLELRRKALQQAIDAELKYQDAKRRGISASSREVEEALGAIIARYPSRAAFQEQIERSDISMAELRTAVRRKETIEKVQRLVADPERVVSRTDAREHFEQHRSEFMTPRRADLREILVKLPPLGRSEADWQAAEARLDAARRRIADGASFEAVAQDFTDTDGEELSGSLRTVHAGSLEPALETEIWRLRPGEVSAPVRGFLGVYLFKVERLYPPEPLTFERVADNLREHLRKQQAEARVASWIEGLRAEATVVILDPELRP